MLGTIGGILLLGGALLADSEPTNIPEPTECSSQDIQTFIRIGVSDKNINNVCFKKEPKKLTIKAIPKKKLIVSNK